VKRIVWLTDIHLDFVSGLEAEEFCHDVEAEAPDAVLIGGDIGDARSVETILESVAGWLGCPVYFVLGNHDFYKGSVADTTGRVRRLCRRVANLVWLDEAGAVELTPGTVLVGVGGWADGAFGRYDGDFAPLNDYYLIEELAGLNGPGRLEAMQSLASDAAEHVRAVLPAAVEGHEETLFLTHVPPFREACWYQGKISGDDWLPHFACKAVGDVLIQALGARPDRRLTVLCGHTHSPGRAEVLPNLLALTGSAEYARPEIQRVLEVE